MSIYIFYSVLAVLCVYLFLHYRSKNTCADNGGIVRFSNYRDGGFVGTYPQTNITSTVPGEILLVKRSRWENNRESIVKLCGIRDEIRVVDDADYDRLIKQPACVYKHNRVEVT